VHLYFNVVSSRRVCCTALFWFLIFLQDRGRKVPATQKRLGDSQQAPSAVELAF